MISDKACSENQDQKNCLNQASKMATQVKELAAKSSLHLGFDPQNFHGGRREPSPVTDPLSSLCVCAVCTHSCAPTWIIITE